MLCCVAFIIIRKYPPPPPPPNQPIEKAWAKTMTHSVSCQIWLAFIAGLKNYTTSTIHNSDITCPPPREHNTLSGRCVKGLSGRWSRACLGGSSSSCTCHCVAGVFSSVIIFAMFSLRLFDFAVQAHNFIVHSD